MPSLADLQSVKTYADGLPSDKRTEFVSRYNALSTEGKATIVSRISGGTAGAADSNLQDESNKQNMLEHVSNTPDMLGNVAQNIKNHPVASVLNPATFASNMLGTVGGVAQRGEDLVARGMSAYMNDNGADIPEVPKGQFSTIGGIMRGVGAPSAVADTIGLGMTGAAPGVSEIGQGARAVGSEALKAAGKAGLGITKYFQTLAGMDAEAINHLRSTGYAALDKTKTQPGAKFIQDLGDEMNSSVQKMRARVQTIWQDFNKTGSKERLDPGVTSTLGQEALKLLQPDQESSKELVDQILQARVNKLEKPYEPVTKVTQREQVVRYPNTEDQYTSQARNVSQGGLSETAGNVVHENPAEGTPANVVKEVTSRTATHYPGRVQTVPVTMEDELNRLWHGDQFTSGELKNLGDMLSNIAGPGAQNNPRAAKLAQLIKNTLRDNSDAYSKASDATRMFSKAEDAASSLYGGSHPELSGKAANAGNIINYFDTPKGSPQRSAPAIIDAVGKTLTGTSTDYLGRVRDAAAVFPLTGAKPSLFASSHLGNISQTATQAGAPGQAAGFVKALLYGLGIPKAGGYVSKFAAGSYLPAMRNARIGQLLNSPAGQFIRSSAAAKVSIDAGSQFAPNGSEE